MSKQSSGPEVVVPITVKSPTEQSPVFTPPENAVKMVSELERVYRAKPLMVAARQYNESGVVETSFGTQIINHGDWLVEHAGIKFVVNPQQFTGMYEVLDVNHKGAIDAGLPDLDPGSEIEKDGKRLIRVVVQAGRGSVAYWFNMAARGGDCQWQVTADMIDNPQASHRVGKFVDPFEGKVGARTWVVVE